MRSLMVLVFVFCWHVLSVAQADNGQWQWIEKNDLRYAVPPDWSALDGGGWRSAQGDALFISAMALSPSPLQLDELIEREFARLQADSVTEIQQEALDLALAPAYRFDYRLASGEREVYIISLVNQRLTAFKGTIASDSSHEASYLRQFGQIADSLQVMSANPLGWSLVADSALQYSLRMPSTWQKQGTDGIYIQETFADAAVHVSSERLETALSLTDLQGAFLRYFRQQGYQVTSSETINLPIGDALLFRLNQGEVRLHQYLIRRDNHLLLVTTQANRAYFAEYESRFEQILNSLEWHSS